MDLFSENLKGFAGDEEANRKLRQLWEQAWERTSVQVNTTLFLCILCFGEYHCSTHFFVLRTRCSVIVLWRLLALAIPDNYIILCIMSKYAHINTRRRSHHRNGVPRYTTRCLSSGYTIDHLQRSALNTPYSVKPEFQMRLPMDNAERLVAKAYGWIDQASHELRWDETYTKNRKGEQDTY